MKLNPWFIATAIFAFASIISFFQIGSYYADKNNFNGVIGFLGIGIASALIACYCLYKTSKTSK